MAVETGSDTKTAIMDSAEHLMAEHGIHGVSQREILREAHANPAALNYHFRTRDGLIRAILARRGHRIDMRRLELLEELDARSTSPSVRDVVDAIVDPMVEALYEHGEAGRRYIRFIARLYSDRTGIVQREEEEHFPEMLARLERLIRTACPHLSKDECQVRIAMLLDTMLQSLAHADVMSETWVEGVRTEPLEKFVSTLKRFLTGGLSAPE